MIKKIFIIWVMSLILVEVAFAKKIIITGSPVILERQTDVYFVPNWYEMTKSYFYVILNGSRQVCYLDKQPNLSALNVSLLEVNYHGSTMNWNCYPLDVNYFQIK